MLADEVPMLLSVVVAAFVGVSPCNLSLLAPTAPPARPLLAVPFPQSGFAEAGLGASAAPPAWRLRTLGFLGGALGSAAGALAGGLLGSALGNSCTGECYGGSDAVLYGALIGFPLGATLGAQLTGSALGGSGRWWGTMLGALGGTLVGTVASLFLVTALDDNSTAYLLVVPLLMPAAGAVAGYELSSGAGARALAPGAGPGGALAPPRAPMLRLRVSF